MSHWHHRRFRILLPLAALLLLSPWAGLASSHREAPLIATDPAADNTDVYAFISPEDSDRLVIIANYMPLLQPASGPNFHSFDDDVAYEICLDNDGDADQDICYRFQFRSQVQDGRSLLYNFGAIGSLTDPDYNARQVYDLFKFEYSGRRRPRRSSVLTGAPVAPWNVGPSAFSDYESVANSAVTTAPSGERTFAGPADDPFFIDLGGIFDVLRSPALDTYSDYNVMSLAIEVPIEDLFDDGLRPPSGAQLGIFARSLRPKTTIQKRNGTVRRGRLMQGSRVGLPLINSFVIGREDKDRYNTVSPYEAFERFQDYLLSPEFNGFLSDRTGVPCAPVPQGSGGVLGMFTPPGATIADLLRLDVSAGQTFDDVAFPNGRRLDEDAADFVLTALCGGTPVSDGVDANDRPFRNQFPYVALPHEIGGGTSAGTPSIVSTPPTTATVASPYTYQLEAIDPDGDTVSFSIDLGPPGMTVGAGSGLVEWTPTGSDVGDNTVRVRAEDEGGLSDTQTYTLAVSPGANAGPRIVSSPGSFAMVGELYSYDVDAEDDDGDPLTYSLGAGPAGMSIDATTGLIGWTPDPSQLGFHSAMVLVSDGRGGTASQTFTINVAPGA